jgi:N-acylneuraminate cytidylyltransferase
VASSNVVVIPARGGSVGIPKKNLLELCGKPLLGWTIEHALNTPEIDDVFVSTDSEEIADYAKSIGAKIVTRPAILSGGSANSESAIQHALDYFKSNLDYNPELVVFLQATSPLRKADDIDNAINVFKNTGADSLFSSSIAADLTIWNKLDDSWVSSNFDYKNRLTRQEAPTQFVENGSIYIFRPEILEQTGNRLGGKIESYLMEPWQVHEIDVVEDIRLIEYYMERYIIGKE